MKIYYSPGFSGHTYNGLSPQTPIIMDEMVLDIMGLIAQLELRLGLHYDEVSSIERLVKYYRSLKLWLDKHKSNEFYEPFITAGLDVARQCLVWRDQLAFDGWTTSSPATSDRLKALQGAEENFREPGFTERFIEVEKALKSSGKDSLAQIIVFVRHDIRQLHPRIQALLEEMKHHGAVSLTRIPKTEHRGNLAKVYNLLASDKKEKTTLNEEDQSLLFYTFADNRAMEQYMAAKAGQSENTLWINADNKATDNWLHRMCKPAMGSATSDSVPQVAQLLVLGIGLFQRPLNIHTLLDWLQPEVHPLEAWFRRELLDTIASEGGFKNKPTSRVIDAFLNGDYKYKKDSHEELSADELEKQKAEERKKRQQQLDTFLPLSFDDCREGMVRLKALRNFLIALEKWAKMRAQLMSEESQNEAWISQLYTLQQMTNGMLILLESFDQEWLSYQQVENLAGGLFRPEGYIQYVAERGCQMTVQSPAQINAMSHNIVWWGVEGDETRHLDCDFLLPSERKALHDELTFWEPKDENAILQQILLNPFIYATDQLVLCCAEKRGGEPTAKHPLIVRLENQITNWKKFICHPNLYEEQWEDVENTSNECGKAELAIHETNKIKWPCYLSPTSLDTLIQWPLDYVMERMLGITATGPGTLPELYTTKGNVAHAVIEQIFGPRKAEDTNYDGKQGERPNAVCIKERLQKEYDSTFADMVDAHGTILHLPKYKIEAKLLKEQLLNSLENLIEVIASNKLRVSGSERRVAQHFGWLPVDKDKTDMFGYIDMTLEDTDHHSVIFDFKWTSGNTCYKNLLTKNESIQLMLYARMLGMETHDEVHRVGYFLMPEAKLYTTNEFVGNNIVRLDAENNDNLVEKVRRSFEYRKKQIDEGIIENGDGQSLESLSYFNADDYERMVSLKAYEEGIHDRNRFSNYNLFKK